MQIDWDTIATAMAAILSAFAGWRAISHNQAKAKADQELARFNELYDSYRDLAQAQRDRMTQMEDQIERRDQQVETALRDLENCRDACKQLQALKRAVEAERTAMIQDLTQLRERLASVERDNQRLQTDLLTMRKREWDEVTRRAAELDAEPETEGGDLGE